MDERPKQRGGRHVAHGDRGDLHRVDRCGVVEQHHVHRLLWRHPLHGLDEVLERAARPVEPDQPGAGLARLVLALLYFEDAPLRFHRLETVPDMLDLLAHRLRRQRHHPALAAHDHLGQVVGHGELDVAEPDPADTRLRPAHGLADVGRGAAGLARVLGNPAEHRRERHDPRGPLRLGHAGDIGGDLLDPSLHLLGLLAQGGHGLTLLLETGRLRLQLTDPRHDRRVDRRCCLGRALRLQDDPMGNWRDGRRGRDDDRTHSGEDGTNPQASGMDKREGGSGAMTCLFGSHEGSYTPRTAPGHGSRRTGVGIFKIFGPRSRICPAHAA